MGYRRGYRKKDGTYVSGYNTRRSYSSKNDNDLSPGCQKTVIVFMIIAFFVLIITCK